MTDKEAYYFRKENHICVDCGRKAKTGQVRCAKCAEKSRVRSNNRIHMRRINGRCVDCNAEITKGTRCDACKAKARDRKRERYKYCREFGLCVNCMSPNGNGKVYCEDCRKINNIKSRERYHNLSDEERTIRVQRSLDYAQKHPDRVAEYNRKYRKKEKERYEL